MLIKKSLQLFIPMFILGILLLVGGLGEEKALVQYNGAIIGVILLGFIWLRERRIRFPPHIILYSLFLILFLVNSLFISVDTKKSLEVFSLFLGGGLFWVSAFNLKKELIQWFDKLIVILGLFFGSMYFINYFLGNSNLVKPWSLYIQSNAYLNHNHIGDLWAIVLTIVGFYLVKNSKKLYLWLLIPLGSYLLLISQSRAALVSLAIGLGYLAYANKWIERYKKAFLVLAVVLAGLFLYLGAAKSILESRPYFAQSIVGLWRNPQGVGIGNFREISKDPGNHILGFWGFSSVAHNIALEVLSGLGILGFVFVYWLYKVLSDLLSDNKKRNILYKSVFFALTANFFFDSTYFIPAMLWLWFTSLGLAHEKPRG